METIALAILVVGFCAINAYALANGSSYDITMGVFSLIGTAIIIYKAL